MSFQKEDEAAQLALDATRHLAVGDRVFVQGNKKRGPTPIKGKEATVVRVLGKGTVMLQPTGTMDPPTRLQQKFTTLLPPPPRAVAVQRPSSAHVAARPRAQHLNPPASAPAAEGTAPGSSPSAEAAPVQTSREILHMVRSQMMADEAEVPWNAVHAFWRNRRSKWRQATNKADKIADMTQRVLDFRNALLLDPALGRCGLNWKQGVDACIAGHGSATQLLRAWQELRTSVQSWLQAGERPTHGSPTDPQAAAEQALRALREAAKQGDSDALMQVPLEAILGHNIKSLQAVKAAIERECFEAASEQKRLLEGAARTVSPVPVASQDSVMMDAETCATDGPVKNVAQVAGGESALDFFKDNFDSGAETEIEYGSQVTVMSDSE